jgi:hypothetical protein
LTVAEADGGLQVCVISNCEQAKLKQTTRLWSFKTCFVKWNYTAGTNISFAGQRLFIRSEPSSRVSVLANHLSRYAACGSVKIEVLSQSINK